MEGALAPTVSLAALESDHNELIDRAKARSPEAWTQIYEDNYERVFRYVKARVFDEATAEDLASAVFVGALKSIDSYRSRGQPMLAWLYGIARHVVADHQRDTFRRSLPGLTGRLVPGFIRGDRSDADALNEITATAPQDEPESLLDSLDLRRAIARLPDNQREVIILRFFVGLNANEVGTLIGKAPAAVYSLQARALVALKKNLR
jgi:RNA polymerase sigma-70 factor (ECF subfamily)